MLVSVIIPCYNVQDYITECVASVHNQTYKNIEIICIDNNSSDNTWNILSELKIKFPNLIIDKETKAGANAARNKGLEISKGEWIQFLDADDLLLPIKIEHQFELLNNSKIEVHFIASACVNQSIDGNQTINSNLKADVYTAPFINKCGNTCANLWKKSALNKIGGWNNNIKSSQETDLMLRLTLDGSNFITDTEPLTIIRERIFGQISQQNPTIKWKQYIDIRITFLNELKNYNRIEYDKNIKLYFDFLMISVLILAKYDIKTANYYYKHHFKNGWKTGNNYGFNKIKVALIKTFGLKYYSTFFG